MKPWRGIHCCEPKISITNDTLGYSTAHSTQGRSEQQRRASGPRHVLGRIGNRSGDLYIPSCTSLEWP
jgi:hypothetical protein